MGREKSEGAGAKQVPPPVNYRAVWDQGTKELVIQVTDRDLYGWPDGTAMFNELRIHHVIEMAVVNK